MNSLIRGVCVSTGSACDSINTNISHVLQSIGLKEEYAKGTIRISLGKANISIILQKDKKLSSLREIVRTSNSLRKRQKEGS